MRKTFAAVYENGVLRPLENLALSDHQHVQVTIEGPHLLAEIAAYFDAEEWEGSKKDDISLQEVRQALATIRGCLSDTVTSAREERF